MSSQVQVTGVADAEDTALLGDGFEAVQKALEGIERYSGVFGLRINAANTRALFAQVAVTQQRQSFQEGVPLEEAVQET